MRIVQKITLNLWFDPNVEEAAKSLNKRMKDKNLHLHTIIP